MSTGAGIPVDSPQYPIGIVFDWPGPALNIPARFLACFGQSLLRSQYRALFNALVRTVGNFTVTLASPGVFTSVAHGLVVGDPVFFETNGALPTGLSADTMYYVMTVPTADTFTVGTTRTVAAATGVVSVTTAVNTSVSQSGTHTLFHAPYGVADATHFNVPDYRGRGSMGLDNMGGSDAARIQASNVVGIGYGEDVHTLTATESGQPGFTTTSGGRSAFHQHTGTTGTESADHNHGMTPPRIDGIYQTADWGSTYGAPERGFAISGNVNMGGRSAAHTHSFTSSNDNTDHTHSVTVSAASAAAAHNNESPVNLVYKIIYAGA